MAVCALTVLDGLGEEATALGGVVVLFLAMALAWLSTHVADRGDHILGTILTVGAHASLIGLGSHESYASPPPSSEPSEQQDEEPAEEDKQEEGEARPDGGEDVPGEELLDIQGGRKKVSYAQGDEVKEEGREEEAEDEAASITVRLKFLNDTEELAVIRPQDTVGLLKSKYFSGREHQIKLIYQGQLLQDPQRSLLSLNITHNSVLHCHVSQAQTLREVAAEENPQAVRGSMLSGGLRSAGVALSTGSLVIPVFVVLLAVIWYFRINYRQLFTAPATISLVGVTVFFSFLIFGMHSR